MLVAEKMKTNSYLVVVTNQDFLELKVKDINFLFPIQDLSVGFIMTFEVEEISIPNSYLFVNRVLDNAGIEILKNKLTRINENIVGICFTDLGVLQVVKKMKLPLKLIYMQNHNTTNATSINYYLEYVDSVLISTDITEEEILTILDKVNKPLVVPYFSLVDAMYSRRTLLKNFQEEFGLEKKQKEVLHENISGTDFLGVENSYGTVFYNKKFIDYRNIEHTNILYRYINPYGLLKEDLEKVLRKEEMEEISTTGFLDIKTYYRLKEDA